MKTEDQLRQEVEELNKEVQKLNEIRVRIEERIAQAQKESAQLSAEFIKEFGTDDIESLERLLQERAEENERLVMQYAQSVKEYQEQILNAQQLIGQIH